MTYQGRGRGRRLSPLQKARRVEFTFAASLRKIARHIGDIAKGFDPAAPEQMARMEDMLRRYGETLTPWAEAAASRMVAEVNRRDAAGWEEISRDMSRSLRLEIETAPTGRVMQARLAESVKLISSLPIEAAERVHKLTLEGILDGARAAEIADEIRRSGDVSRSRATLIARTEVARTSSALTEARALHVGCTHFVWKTSEDGDVRSSHKKMANKVCEFANPPIVDGEPLLPGMTYNCRCYIEPILTDD